MPTDQPGFTLTSDLLDQIDQQRTRAEAAEQERDQTRAELADEQATHAKTISNFEEYVETSTEAQKRLRYQLDDARRDLTRARQAFTELANTGSPAATPVPSTDAQELSMPVVAGAPDPSKLPREYELAFLRQAKDEADLDVAEDELLDHHRTQTYRTLLQAAYAVGWAIASGYEVTVNDLGDRVGIGDHPQTPAPPAVAAAEPRTGVGEGVGTHEPPEAISEADNILAWHWRQQPDLDDQPAPAAAVRTRAALMHPHHLHALTAAWSLHRAVEQLQDAARRAATAGLDDGIRSTVWGNRHGTGRPGDPVSTAVLTGDGHNSYEVLLGNVDGTVRWLADHIAPGPGAPLQRLLAAIPTTAPATLAEAVQWLAEADRRIRRELRLPPDEQPLPDNPCCPACRSRLLRVHTAAPDRAHWTAGCGAHCICTGAGCPCGMPVRVDRVEHIWTRANLFTALRTARRRAQAAA